MAYRSSSTNAVPALSCSVTPPAGIVDGDILIGWLSSDSAVTGSVALPAGFTAFTGLPVSSDLDGMAFTAGYKKAASESGNYVFTDTHNIVAGVICMSGEDASLYLHKQSIGSAGAPGDPTQWDIISAAFASNTTGTCDIVFIGVSDSNVSTAVQAMTQTEPAGLTKRATIDNGTFFTGFVATKDGAASGETGAYTAHGDQVGATAGFACAAVALLNAAGTSNNLAWIKA